MNNEDFTRMILPVHDIEHGEDLRNVFMTTIQDSFPSFLTFEENIKWSLEPGRLADMIVLDRDILTCPVDDIKDAKVLTTYLGGEVVYEV